MVSKPIYLVCGFPRSGTSMMMRALQAGGIPCVYDSREDNKRNAACAIPDYVPNPHGFYEANLPAPEQWHTLRGRAIKIIHGNLHTLPNGEEYRAAYMLRNPNEIRESYRSVAGPLPHHQETFSFIDRYVDGITSDQVHLLKLKAEITVLNFADVIHDPRGHLSRLGWPIDVAAAAATIDRNLYRHRAKDLTCQST